MNWYAGHEPQIKAGLARIEAERKRGRPSKNKRGTFTFRVTATLREQLVKAASDNGRSVSEEIEYRLDKTFTAEAKP